VLHCHSCLCLIVRRTKAGPTFGETLGVMLEHSDPGEIAQSVDLLRPLRLVRLGAAGARLVLR
jgi:hypothetical protein